MSRFKLFRIKPAPQPVTYDETILNGRIVTQVLNGETVTSRVLVTSRVTVKSGGWTHVGSEVEYDGEILEAADATRATRYLEPGRRITVENGIYVLRRNWPGVHDRQTRITGTAVSMGDGHWHVEVGDPLAVVNGVGKTFTRLPEAEALRLLWAHG